MRKSFSALSAAACENLSAVLGSHSLHKAVLVLSLELLGLVSSFHLSFPPQLFFLRRGTIIPYTATHIKLLYLIIKALSRGFWKFHLKNVNFYTYGFITFVYFTGYKCERPLIYPVI